MPYPENADGITVNTITIANPQVGIQLQNQVIPQGCEIVILANPANTGVIYVFPISSTVNNLNAGFPLLPGQSISYKIKNARNIQVTGTTIGDKAIVTVEMNNS